MENNKKISLIEEIDKLTQKMDPKDVRDSIAVVFEIDDNGFPIGQLCKIKGGPLQTIGMIDVMVERLLGIKDQIHEKLNNVENFSKKITKGLDNEDEIKKKLNELENRGRKAAQNNDDAEMEQITKELKDLLGDLFDDIEKKMDEEENKPFKNDTNKDNFDDFKNM